MDKDQVKGKAKQAEGLLEEAAGKIVGDKDMERNGKLKNTLGKVQFRHGESKSNIRKSK